MCSQHSFFSYFIVSFTFWLLSAKHWTCLLLICDERTKRNLDISTYEYCMVILMIDSFSELWIICCARYTNNVKMEQHQIKSKWLIPFANYIKSLRTFSWELKNVCAECNKKKKKTMQITCMPNGCWRQWSDWSKNETNENNNNKSTQQILHPADPINMRRIMKRIWNERIH